MHADTQPEAHTAQAMVPKSRIVITLLFAVITASVLMVLWPTTRSMIDTWQQSSA